MRLLHIDKCRNGVLRAADCFTAVFFWLICLSALYGMTRQMRNGGLHPAAAAGLIFTAVAAAAGLLLTLRLIGNSIDRAGLDPDRVFLILDVTLFMLQLEIAILMPFQTRNDLSYVCRGAKNIVLHGVSHINDGTPKWDPAYFYTYPNNRLLVIILSVLYRAEYVLTGSMTDLLPKLVNAVGLNLSYLFLYLTARTLGGKRTAIRCALYGLLVTPFLSYVSYFYTDAMTMPLLMGSVYCFALWAKLSDRAAASAGVMGAGRSSSRAASSGPACVVKSSALSGALKRGALLTGSVLLLAIAYEMKGSAGLLLPVYCLYFLFHGRIEGLKSVVRRLLLAIFTAGLFGAAVHLIGRGMVSYLELSPVLENKYQFPFIHWVMMSASGSGGYRSSDYDFTEAHIGYANKTHADLLRLLAKLRNQGTGFITHLFRKMQFTWTDGTYMAAHYNRQSALFTSGTFATLACISHLALLFLMVGSAIRAFLNPGKCSGRLFRTAVAVLALFLLIWETKSRYLVLYLPLMALCGISEPLAAEAPERDRAAGKKKISVDA